MTDVKKRLPVFISKKELADLLGVSERTIDREVRAGRLPPPMRISPNRVGWLLDAILQHFEQRDTSGEIASILREYRNSK